MSEDILQEEVISLKPIEKITAMVGENVQRAEIQEIREFQLTREKLPLFRVIIRKELSNQLQHLSYIMNRIIKKFEIYPHFNDYFKAPASIGTARNPSHNTGMGIILTTSELKRNGDEIMEELREFVPTLMLATEVAVEGLEKTWSMISEPPRTAIVINKQSGNITNMRRMGVEWGQGKTDKAWLMSQDGKTKDEIGVELGINPSQVPAYIVEGLKRGAKLGIIKSFDEEDMPTVEELKKEKVEAEKPLENIK